MTDMNSQSKPKDLTPAQQWDVDRKKWAIEAHQHRNDNKDDFINETD